MSIGATRCSSRIYIAAAWCTARILAAPEVQSVFIRRSVVTGDAVFPQSDLDLGLVIRNANGAAMAALYRRMRIAKALFPRLGEVQATTQEELNDMAESDPYRASLDRRSVMPVYGERPTIPQYRLTPMAVARRLVFWLDPYVPRAVRQRRRRDQIKFLLEMWNAWKVLQGEWAMPQLSRRAVMDSWTQCGLEDGAAHFAQCCRLAEQALAWMGLDAPTIDYPVVLRTQPRTVLLPRAEAAWTAEALQPNVRVFTPAAFALFMETQNPILWFEAREQLESLGFAAPARSAWIAACLHLAGGERLRRPGFTEPGPGRHAQRLARLRAVIAWLEDGQHANALSIPETKAAPTVSAYYREQFDGLSEEAALLRQRVRSLAPAAMDRSR